MGELMIGLYVFVLATLDGPRSHHQGPADPAHAR